MKKRLALLLALTLLLSLPACSLNFLNRYGGDGEPASGGSPSDSVEAQEPAVSEPPAQSGEPAAPESPEESRPDTEDGEAAPERKVMSSHEDVTLFFAGDTFRLTVWDSNGNAPDACSYTSADPSVAAVDGTGGEVTAVAPGTTTVTVHAEYGEEKLDFSCIVRCRWEAEEADLPEESADAAAEAPSLAGFFSTLQAGYEGLDAMMAMEGDLLDNYYPGLSGSSAVESALVQETLISIANMAVGLVKLSDSATQADVAAVESIFQARIDAQADGGAWYPESCATWERGIVLSAGNYVGMFVHPDSAQAMADLFSDTYGG